MACTDTQTGTFSLAGLSVTESVCLSVCLAGWLAGWLAGCLSGCLAGWLAPKTPKAFEHSTIFFTPPLTVAVGLTREVCVWGGGGG